MNLHLDKLRLRNFRCFSECTVTFHENLTILVADNGRGKTAIMDAASTVLAQFVDEFTDCRQSEGIAQSDVRLARGDDGIVSPRTPTRLDAEVTIDGAIFEWRCEPRRSSKGLSHLFAVVNELRSRGSPPGATEEGLLLPAVSYYSSTRFSHNGYFGSRKKKHTCRLDDRLDGYRDYLDPLSDSRHFNEWYERMVAAVRTHAPVGASRYDSPLRQLTAVRAAVNSVLEPTGWGHIDWDGTLGCVVAEHPVQGRLPLVALSSGVRNMVALTADLAFRCARLNPTLGEDAALRTPGVVLIDEVDLHLHPAWQQRVVGLLREAFPAIQFILSTHSPQVLSTVYAKSIRVIRLCDGDGQIETPRFQTRGVESANVLATIMGVDPVPGVEEAEMLNRYRALIEDGTHDADEGRDLRDRLVKHFEPQHPLMLDCDRLIRFSAFKRRTAGGD